MTNLQPVLITSGMGVVVVSGNIIALYVFMAIISVTCVVWTISIIRDCKEKNKRLEAMKSRAVRREAKHGNATN